MPVQLCPPCRRMGTHRGMGTNARASAMRPELWLWPPCGEEPGHLSLAVGLAEHFPPRVQVRWAFQGLCCQVEWVPTGRSGCPWGPPLGKPCNQVGILGLATSWRGPWDPSLEGVWGLSLEGPWGPSQEGSVRSIPSEAPAGPAHGGALHSLSGWPWTGDSSAPLETPCSGGPPTLFPITMLTMAPSSPSQTLTHAPVPVSSSDWNTRGLLQMCPLCERSRRCGEAPSSPQGTQCHSRKAAAWAGGHLRPVWGHKSPYKALVTRWDVGLATELPS